MSSEYANGEGRDWVRKALEDLRERCLFRRPDVYAGTGRTVVCGSVTLLNFSSNDYLDLANDPGVIAAAARCLEKYGAGATASRLVTGTLSCHAELEERLAGFKGYGAALVFGSGYLTNAGVIPSVVGRHDRVFADRLAHASIVDAVALSRARLCRFDHNDPGHLASLLEKAPADGRRLVVTESVFSMNGDLAPLCEISEVAAAGGALFMVDEAHATGVFGPAGGGLIQQLGLEGSVALSMGTLSKALGGYGGYVACSPRMRELLVNRARAFIYTTGLPPPSVGAALGALDALRARPGMGAVLREKAAFFRDRLRDAGLDTAGSESQIVPVIVGSSSAALVFSGRLREKGVLGVAIRPPTVPEGTARVRFSVTMAHSEEDLARASDAVVDCARREGLI